MLYACDAAWWHRHAVATGSFRGRKITLDGCCTIPSVEKWREDRRPGLSLDPGVLRTGHAHRPGSDVICGGNSGYQALNLAVQLGARRIVLLGYDMQPGPNGETHHHGHHPAGLNNPVANHYPAWIAGFRTTVPDLARLNIDVVNCTSQTALDVFPRLPLREALERCERSPARPSTVGGR